MTYQRLDFENRKAGVFVASGLGFKAPKGWGRSMMRPASIEEDARVRSGTVRWIPLLKHWYRFKLTEVDENRHIDEMIETEIEELEAFIKNSVIPSLVDNSDHIDVKLIVASAEARPVLISQKRLVADELQKARKDYRTELSEREGRIEGLKELRSRRKERTS